MAKSIDVSGVDIFYGSFKAVEDVSMRALAHGMPRDRFDGDESHGRGPGYARGIPPV